jgi:hypothetical protein
MNLVLFFIIYLLVLCSIFINESTQAIPHPDETFDKTHGIFPS